MDNISHKEFLRAVYTKEAVKSAGRENKEAWRSCLWCSRVVGKYDRGATLGLADDMGKSIDTVEDRAHAYMIFEQMCNYENGEFRPFVFAARRSPFIYWSHFRALWDAKNSYETITLLDLINTLMDIVQAEGGISSRKVDEHIQKKYGETKKWQYYGKKINNAIMLAIEDKNMPRRMRADMKKMSKKLSRYLKS